MKMPAFDLLAAAPAWQWAVLTVLAAFCVALAVTDIVLLVLSKKSDRLPAENGEPQEETTEVVSEAPAEEAITEDVSEAPAEEVTTEEVSEAPAEEATAEEVSEESVEEATAEEISEAPAEEATTEEVSEVPAEEATAEEVSEAPAEEAITEEVSEEPAEEVTTEEVSEEPVEEAITEESSNERSSVEEELAVVAAVRTEEDEEGSEEDEGDEDDDFAADDDEEIEEIEQVETVQESETGMSSEERAQIVPNEGGLPFVVIPFAARDKKIYVRYNFSFRAKLIQADRDIQSRYGQIADEINSYDRVKMSLSWKQVRIYSGRNTLAMLLFKGRKLCMSFALDPKDFEGTKYKGKDVSEIKRFKKTPMLLKLTSARKAGYARYLFGQVAEKFGLQQNELIRTEFFLPYRTTEELIEQKLVKVLSSDPLQKDANLVMADIGTLIREQISLKEARNALTDEQAAELMEHETRGVLDEEEVRTVSVSKGEKKGIINIDTLSANFNPDDTVTPEILKEMKLIPKNVGSLKILARGVLDKPLNVEAQDFSLDAVKMIVLTGGKAIKIL